MDIILDADHCIAGRTASRAAKELLKGKTVAIVNAEKAVISGSPRATIVAYRERVDRGDPYHGPFYPRTPERILKRMVRGMLPYKKTMGRDALKHLRVFVSVPADLQSLPTVKAKDLPHGQKAITLGELALHLRMRA
ncbi:MAG: 50S ribosomal protein L13 [Candidatus Aenigmarchaeota archaeon]|nr:50S ribosomal protein L13 [Candidatus Aenigmarchaeota archaeon]